MRCDHSESYGRFSSFSSLRNGQSYKSLHCARCEKMLSFKVKNPRRGRERYDTNRPWIPASAELLNRVRRNTPLIA